MLDKLFYLLLKTGAVGLVILLLILIALYFFQNKLIYMPDAPLRFPNQNPQGYRDPSEMDLAYEDVYITTADNVKLHGWFIKHEKSSQCPTVVYFHENAGNIGTRLSYIKYYTKIFDTNVLLVAYRGYSYSEGSPTEEGLKLDGLAVLDYIFSRQDINKDKIFVHGRSLGGAVSVYAVGQNKHKVAGLILENTFTSMGDMVDRVFPKLARFKALVLRNNWNSVGSIKNVKAPILFILSLKDELVPAEHMIELYQKAANAEFRERHDIAEGDHNAGWTVDVNEYFRAVNNFMNKCLKH